MLGPVDLYHFIRAPFYRSQSVAAFTALSAPSV